MCILIGALLGYVGHAHASIPTAALAYRATIVREAESQFGVPAPTPVIAAQIMQESGFNPGARSGVGASGLMQFMPQTAEWAAVAGQLGQANPMTPAWAIRAGVWYDHYLLVRVRAATDCDRWNFALSAYNGGLGNVYKRQSLSAKPFSWDDTGYINPPGVSADNQQQNEDYSVRILMHWQTIFTSWGKTECLD
ncbi:MAG: transglycosylase SLT domain-containing protein [Pararobbsia sp.]